MDSARIAGVESPMTARWPLPFVLLLGAIAARAAGPTVTIDTTSPSGKVSPLFYGLMTEEINHAYDGGLYAELVHNRAFLDDAAAPGFPRSRRWRCRPDARRMPASPPRGDSS